VVVAFQFVEDYVPAYIVHKRVTALGQLVVPIVERICRCSLNSPEFNNYSINTSATQYKNFLTRLCKINLTYGIAYVIINSVRFGKI